MSKFRKSGVVADPDDFMECFAEALIWEATLDLAEGAGRKCECDKRCVDRKACAQRWFDGGKATLPFDAACAYLGMNPEKYLEFLNSMAVAKRRGIQGACSGFDGTQTLAFRRQLQKAFVALFGRSLNVLDWAYRNRKGKTK